MQEGHSCWTPPAPESSLEELPSHQLCVNKPCLVGSAAEVACGSELGNLCFTTWMDRIRSP